MIESIDANEFQRRFRAVLDEVSKKRVSYVLATDNRPMAVLLPYDEFIRFLRLQEPDLHARFERLTARMGEVNAQYTEEEVAADIEAARAEVAAEKTARENRAS